MLRSFPSSFPVSANTKFKPLDPMSKDQLALETKDGTIQCDHPTCNEPLDTTLCTDRCLVVECDAGVVNEQCEQGCVVDRAYGCPYDKEESSSAPANDDVSITISRPCCSPRPSTQLSYSYHSDCVCTLLKIRLALIAFFPVLRLPIHVTSNGVLACKYPSQYRSCFDIHHVQPHSG